MRASYGAFERRHDKHFFEILSKHKDVQSYILANIVDDNPNVWVSQIANEQTAESVFKRWLKRQESITYMFKNELEALDDDFNANIVCEDGHHPILLKKTLQGAISIETLIILNDFTKFFRYWNRKIKEDIIWPTKHQMLKKYKPFLKYDAEKFKKIVVDRFKCS